MALQRAAHALRILLPPPGPTPTGRLPGYLRVFSAEAVPSNGTLDSEDPLAAVQQSQAAIQDAAKQAYSQLVQTIFSQALHAAEGAPHTPAFEGLQALEEQRRAAGLEPDGASASPPHVARTLAAVRYHQRWMDGTPAGRKLQKNWQRQLILETRAIDAAKARYRREAESAIKRDAGATLPAARKLLVGWFRPLEEAIRAEQYRVAKGTSGLDRTVYGPYLLRLDPEQLAVIAMHATLTTFLSPDSDYEAVGATRGTSRMVKLATAIGRAVESQYHVNRLEGALHKQNMERREVKALYAKGKELRARFEAEGSLSEEDWQAWFKTGDALRALGEILPSDHLTWFHVSRFSCMAAQDLSQSPYA